MSEKSGTAKNLFPAVRRGRKAVLRADLRYTICAGAYTYKGRCDALAALDCFLKSADRKARLRDEEPNYLG